MRYHTSKSGDEQISLKEVLFLWEALTFPLKWRKTLAGRQINWIGYHFDFEAEAMGLSEHRAGWVLNWIQAESANAHQVHPQGRCPTARR